MTLCGGYQIAGESKMTKEFKLSFTPTSLYVTFDLYLIDTWDTHYDNSEKYYINVLVNDELIQTISTNFDKNQELP